VNRPTTRRLHALSALLGGLYLFAGSAAAHHEAIFGPQSSLMLTAPTYVSLQAFSRQLGGPEHRTQESTMLLSAGVTPLRDVPLSLTAILPASNISGPGGHHEARRGLEDLVVGARYRLELEGLQERFDAEGNLLLGMVAVELPTGSIDHEAFDGPVNQMAALLGSLERGPFSGIAYGLYRRHGTHLGLKAGDQIYTGGGLAWTPFDDPATERLLSFQAGLSYELYRRDRQGGQAIADSGGHGVYVHPTIVWGPGGHTLLFAMVTLPLLQRFEDPHERNRWRAGAGVVHLF
jgi:hypothetical protein